MAFYRNGGTAGEFEFDSYVLNSAEHTKDAVWGTTSGSWSTIPAGTQKSISNATFNATWQTAASTAYVSFTANKPKLRTLVRIGCEYGRTPNWTALSVSGATDYNILLCLINVNTVYALVDIDAAVGAIIKMPSKTQYGAVTGVELYAGERM